MTKVPELSTAMYNNTIRMLKSASIPRANLVMAAAAATMVRLGVKENPRSAASGVPTGSDQVNIRTLLDWMDAIIATDQAAVRQLVAVHATASHRVTG